MADYTRRCQKRHKNDEQWNSCGDRSVVPYHQKYLSPEAIEAIAHLFNDVEKHGVWPGHIYYNIIVLMGKSAGRSRPLALMPMLHRLWTKIRRPYIIKWELSHQGPWDAAGKGSSALRAGLLSLFQHEISIRLGMDSLVTLWDVEKFYDNIDICIPADEAARLEYPTTQALLNF